MRILTVGDVARRADVHPNTVRGWVRIGLLVPCPGTGGAQRLFTLAAVDRCVAAWRQQGGRPRPRPIRDVPGLDVPEARDERDDALVTTRP